MRRNEMHTNIVSLLIRLLHLRNSVLAEITASDRAYTPHSIIRELRYIFVRISGRPTDDRATR